MNKLKTTLCVMAIALATCVAYAPNVGETSKQWKVVYVPCEWCETTNNLEIHHIWPQHLYPEYAHDTNRMVCLCRRCHLVLGHRGCFTNAVTNLIKMIAEGKK